jgi:hypothetical protein
MAKKKQPGGLALDVGHQHPLNYKKMGGSTKNQLSVDAHYSPAAVEAAAVARRQKGERSKPPKDPLIAEIRSHMTPSGRLRRKS